MAYIPHLNRVAQSKIARLNRAAFTWLAAKLTDLLANKTTPDAVLPEAYSDPQVFGPGDVYMYHYDAKWKNKLPYWDKFPCTIVLEIYNDGFLGLNLHYLPPNIRFAFMSKLVKRANNPRNPLRRRMNLSYEIVKGAQDLGAYIPCLKRYLTTHVVSNMFRIPPQDWELVVHMPVAQFTGASQKHVWADSRKKIK